MRTRARVILRLTPTHIICHYPDDIWGRGWPTGTGYANEYRGDGITPKATRRAPYWQRIVEMKRIFTLKGEYCESMDLKIIIVEVTELYKVNM